MTGFVDASFLVTCEHGGNTVPPAYAELFKSAGARADLRSHRGYDPGALAASEQFQQHLGAELIASTTTRLLVDLNRSIDNAELFSKYTRYLSPHEKAELLAEHYHPYRQRTVAAIEKQLAESRPVIHLSVHTFTPRFKGVWRHVDVGLLFDPDRKFEVSFCEQWRQRLASSSPSLRVRPNEPYKGVDDGFTAALRRQYAARDYVGVEIEINNRFAKRSVNAFAKPVKALLQTLPHRTLTFDGSDTHLSRSRRPGKGGG